MKALTRFTVFAAVLMALGCSSTPDFQDETVSVLADDGSWCWFGDPRAVSFRGKRSRTYAGTLTSGGDIILLAMDNKNGETESVVLSKGFEKDDHANPSVTVRDDGHILVFYSKHAGRAIFQQVSTRPEDITSFSEPQRLDLNPHEHSRSNYCYPNPIWTEGKLFMFWRGENWKPTLSESADGGRTWAKARIAFSGVGAGGSNRPYTKYAVARSGGIHMAVTDGHPRNEPTNNIYYSRLKGGRFYSADGRAVAEIAKAPLRPGDADLVHDGSAGEGRAWIWDVAEDGDGHPVLLYAVLPKEEDHRFHYARWDGKKWITHEITSVGGWFPSTPKGKREREPHYSGGAILDHEDPDTVYISRQVNGIFEMERWTTNDHGSSWTTHALTRNSTRHNIRPFVPRGHRKNGGPSVIWVHVDGHYIHYTDYRSRLMMSSTVPVAEPSGKQVRAPSPRNVLFIAVDDLRPELGCYGASHMQTPCMDAFAQQARLFQRHYAVVPTCGASRYALMTGAHPRQSRAMGNYAFSLLRGGGSQTQVPLSMPAYFRQEGYHTVSIGKISHSPDGMIPSGRGDSAARIPEMPNAWDVLSGPIGRWGSSHNAFFGYPDGSTRKRGKTAPFAKASRSQSRLPDELTADQAIRFLKRASHEEPFFLAVGFFKPHLPFVAPARDFAKYRNVGIPVPSHQQPPSGAEGSPGLHRSGEMFNNYQHPKGARSDAAWHEELRVGYCAATSYVDSQVGRVLRALRSAGLADNTVVCIWGDHGWHLGSQGLWGKHSLFEEALRSTLIIRAPGMVEPGKATSALIESTDLFPTLASLSLIDPPSVPDGVDLAACVMRAENPGRSHAFAYWKKGVSIRGDRYRFTEWRMKSGSRFLELYDHHNDPGETLNIAEASPEIVAHFQQLALH